ncbi:hypothetical protein [Runella limosa]|uniref:hypothetical protein n=1 Tax=Runella limosa TaxID=370978 RepID=UPI0004167535|nr:hypothetical protein [Runella limosa]
METPSPEKSNWIQELSNQSWNLELVVSGAAIFSTSFLPELTDAAIESYFENYQLSNSIFEQVLPILAYSFAKSSAYLLIFTFVVHFIIRAFWIAIVGLRAVFPQGINFENLPNTNKELAESYEKKFGSLDGFIIRLDRISSQIFSIAFVMVLFSLMLTIMYIVTFAGTVGLKTYFPVFYSKAKPVFMVAGGSIMVLSLVIVLLSSKEKYREHPFFSKLLKQYIAKSAWMYMGMYKPIQYINFTFASNLPRKKYFLSLASIGFLFFGLAISIYVEKILAHNSIPTLESRKFYSTGTSEHKLTANYYDNLRPEGERIEAASIQSDVVEEPFLKLYINYSKVFDTDLAKICQEPTLPDSIRKYKRRLLVDKNRLECFNQYFKIALNDSTFDSVELFFEDQGNTKGLRTYLSTEKCKIGRNTLYIKTMNVDSLPKKVWTDYVAVPFWYAKD